MFTFKRKPKEDFSSRAAPGPRLTVRRGEGRDIVMKGLKLTRPDSGETLIDTFDLTLKPGDRMVVTGPRGSGKSTLMRAIGGIWDSGEGEIILPENARILAVPQKPYLPDIPLRDILSYPDSGRKFGDDEIKGVLHTVGLDRLAEPALNDREHTGSWWSSRLSLGEQQALIFARILLYKPDVLMIDEVSASLDEKSEHKLYKAVLQELPGATVISVSHHRSVIPFHTLHADIGAKRMDVKPVTQEAEKPALCPCAP